MPEIDRSVPIPIYYQLLTLLKQQIEQGELQPGDRLPTEAELCERYAISRNPIQRAMRELEAAGLIVRSARRGTFVRAREQETVTLRITAPDGRALVPGVHWRWPLERAVERWNADHTGARIHLEFDNVAHRNLFDHLSRTVAEGHAADIAVLDTVWVAEFAERHYLYALDELAPEWAKQHQVGFYAPLLHANSYQGHQYTLPTNADISILWYRRDWFAQENLTPPHDWDTLVTAGQHFQRTAVRKRYGLSAHPVSLVGGRAGGETTTYQFLSLLWSAGGDVVDGGRVVLDSAATRRVLVYLKTLTADYHIATPDVVNHAWDGALRDFAGGEVAMAFGGTYENALISSLAGWNAAAFFEHVGFVPLLALPDRAPTVLVGGMAYGILRQTEHPRLALDLLTRMLEPGILKPFSLRMNQNAAYWRVDQTIQRDENPLLSYVTPLLEHGRVRPALRHYTQVSRQLQELIEVVLRGQISIDAAASRAAERISGITDLPIAP